MITIPQSWTYPEPGAKADYNQYLGMWAPCLKKTTYPEQLANDDEEVKGYFLQSPAVVPPLILGGMLR